MSALSLMLPFLGLALAHPVPREPRAIDLRLADASVTVDHTGVADTLAARVRSKKLLPEEGSATAVLAGAHTGVHDLEAAGPLEIIDGGTAIPTDETSSARDQHEGPTEVIGESSLPALLQTSPAGSPAPLTKASARAGNKHAKASEAKASGKPSGRMSARSGQRAKLHLETEEPHKAKPHMATEENMQHKLPNGGMKIWGVLIGMLLGVLAVVALCCGFWYWKVDKKEEFRESEAYQTLRIKS